MAAPSHIDPLRDPERLAALRRAALLDTPPEERFDRAVRIVARALRAPIVVLSLVDQGRRFVKSAVGLPEASSRERALPLEGTACHRIVTAGEPLEIADVHHDAVAAAHGIRLLDGAVAYLGHPVASSGAVIGSLDALDVVAREWTDRERATLADGAHMIEEEIERRVAETVRDRGADRLGTAERWYQVVVDTMSEGVTIQNADGTVGAWNAGAERILGLTGEQLAGRDPFDPRWGAVREDGSPFPEDEHPAMRTLRTGEPARDERMGVKTPEGERRWLRLNTRPLRRGSAPPHGVVVTFADITASVEAERMLRARQEQYRRLVESVREVIFTIDADGRWTYLNPAWEELTGVGVADALGAPYTAFVHHDDRAATRARFASLMTGEIESCRAELRFATRDGGWRTTEAHALGTRDRAGRIVGISGTITDITARVHALHALAAAQERLQSALLASKIGTWSWDVAQRHFTWDDMVVRLTGVPPGGAPGGIEAILDRVHPDDRARVAEAFAGTVAGADDYDFEFRVVRPDGDLRWLSARGRMLRDAEGRAVRLAGAVVDVTDRRRAAEALEQSEQRYRQLVEQAPEAIFVFDADAGHFVDANAAAERMFGLSRDELLRLGPVDLSPPVQPDGRPSAETAAGLLAAALAGDVQAFEWTHTDAGGRPFLAEVRIARHPSPGRLVRGSIVDISARKETERARDRLAAILEATSDFVGMTGPDLGIIYVNGAGRRMLGLEGENLIGRPLASFHPPWAAALLTETAVPTALREGSWSGETALLAADGREIPASQVILAHRSPAGPPDFFGTVVRDLTERKRLEQQVAQAQKMEAIGTLAGGIAHDFNNLLTAVLGHCAVLLAEGGLTPAAREDVTEIRRAGERAAALTGQLLAFGRRQVLQPQPLDLTAVVVELGGMLRRLLRADLTFETAAKPGLPPAVADPSQLSQVLVNLVVNARDATPPGGVIRVEADTVEIGPGPTAGPESPPPGRYVALSVSDSGVGIDPTILDRIFEPFFTTKSPGKGTGLGLSMVLGIVRQSGGYLQVESEPGRGSRFRVLFPPATEGPAPEPAAPTPPARGAGETILVVEDEPTVRRVLARLLQRNGYRVITAEHGLAALDIWAASRDRIDLLLTDIVMPELGGRELVGRLRADRPDLRVVFVSGYDERAGLDELPPNAGFVLKPFDSRELLARLREIIER